jgi:sugar O-acyltransferase (sialic acid O-acetyltransferase NeuD family)
VPDWRELQARSHTTQQTMKTLGIFGTSGFASEIEDIADELGWRAIFVARDKDELDMQVRSREAVLERDVLRFKDMPFAIGIAEPGARKTVSERFRNELEFINLIHPSATFGKGQRQVLESRKGVIVAAGARFMSRIQVGDFAAFDLNVTVGHDAVVGDFAHIAPGANISGNVHIGARCWIGTGAIINQGSDTKKLVIGEGSVVGSGTVVVKDCDPSSVYVGNPARKIK